MPKEEQGVNMRVSCWFFLLSTVSCLALRSEVSLSELSYLWDKEEYSLAEKELIDTLARTEEKSLKSGLRCLLADLYFHQNLYREALQIYEEIDESSLQEKILPQYAHCLLELEEYGPLYALTKEAPSLRSYTIEALAHLIAGESHGQKQKAMAQELLERMEEQNSYRDVEIHFEACTLLGLYREATSDAMRLADLFPEKREDFLFKAALMVSTTAPAEACRLLRDVAPVKEEAKQLLPVLKFLSNDYAAIVAEAPRLSDHPLLNWIYGKSHLEMGCPDKALSFLAEAHKKAAAEFRIAIAHDLLLAAIACNNQMLAEETLCTLPPFKSSLKLKTSYLLVHGDPERASESLLALLGRYPCDAEREAMLYDYALLQREAESTLAFFKEFPQSPLAPSLISENNLELVKNFLSAESVLHALAKMDKKTERFALAAEAALQQFSDLQEAEKLHLHLFNYYRQIDEKRAADHLFEVLCSDKLPLQLKNMEWLANFYRRSKEDARAEMVEQKLGSLYEQDDSLRYDFKKS